MGVCSCSWLPGLILAWPSMAVAIAWQWRVTNSKQKGKKTGEQIFLKKSNLELSLHWPNCQVRLSCSGLKVWKGLGHLTTLQHWGGGRLIPFWDKHEILVSWSQRCFTWTWISTAFSFKFQHVVLQAFYATLTEKKQQQKNSRRKSIQQFGQQLLFLLNEFTLNHPTHAQWIIYAW